jgi:hypothetical protein
MALYVTRTPKLKVAATQDEKRQPSYLIVTSNDVLTLSMILMYLNTSIEPQDKKTHPLRSTGH